MSARILSNIASSASGAFAPSRRSALTAALTVATCAVALLHVVMLWDRVRSGAILEPAVVLRWTGAALLMWLVRCLLRPEGSTSRLVRSIALASLVALLHLAFVAPAATTSDSNVPTAAILAMAVPLGVAAGFTARALVARARARGWGSRCCAALAGCASLGRCFIELTRLPHFLARHSLAFRAPPA